MMKTKYNDRFSLDDNRTEQHGSYIQTYLEDEINFLLAPSANLLNRVDFKDIYIHNCEMENVLNKYKKRTNSNNVCVIEGLTGSGKTMLVRYAFNIHSWKPILEDKTLIIPFSFDNALYADVKDIFERMIHASCRFLYETFPDLMGIDDHPEEFITYIKENRFDLLNSVRAYPEPTDMEQLTALLNKNPLAFYSSALKFYLSQTGVCQVNNVVLVIDDIEGIRVDGKNSNHLQQELLPIEMTLELCECMQNRGGHAVPWSLNTIICCRHYVSRMMKTLPFSLDEQTSYSQKLESYAVCNRYDLKKAPPLMGIIEKRYDAILKKESQATEKWTTAMQVVKQILVKVDSEMTEFILGLTLNNMRTTMNCVKHLVMNKRWIQRDYVPNHPGAFVISDLDQYNLKPPTLIRAIGMNESFVYNPRESIIPNLLHNEPHSESDLFPLLTLKYFLTLAQYHGMSWDSSLSLSQFRTAIVDLEGLECYKGYFENSLRFLLEHRLLLRSYDQEQRDNRALNHETIKEIEYVYVPQGTINLWNRLRSTSVFFEMFIDDIWLENENRGNVKSPYRGFDTENFEMCLQYMFKLVDTERAIYLQIVNLTQRKGGFTDFFGTEPLCVHLLAGLENSMNSYYRQSKMHPSEEKTLNNWRYTIQVLKKRCAAIYE